MNDVIKTITNHRSIREYTNKKVTLEETQLIINAAQWAPSSVNGQHVTMIVVQDEERKAKLSEYCGNQPWINQAPVFIVFCLDFNRAKIATDKYQVDLKVIEQLESTIIGSVDVGLAMQNAITAAESLGLGTVPIGGIRNQPLKVIELLEIPEYVFPICGLVVGHPKNTSDQKPRLPINAVLHYEHYNNKDLKKYVDDYDQTMSDYMLKRTNGQSNRNFSETIASYYKNPTRDNRTSMKKQGFENK